MRATARPPSGRTILKAIRDELMLTLYPLPFSTLPGSVYHVYLHPRDFEVVEGVVPRMVEQVQRALTADVEAVNLRLGRRRHAWLARLAGGAAPDLAPIEIPAAGWEIHVQPDLDGEIEPGQLGIVSTLCLQGTVEYAGTPTSRIVKSVVSAGGRTATISHVPVSVSAPAGGATTDAAERARLTYEDDQGRHVFSVRKDTLSVGRGGSSAWVDVQVFTTAKVSREHFRVRRDESGRFFIQDVSSWGTSVDGQALPPALKSDEGVVQPGAEQPLPLQARIALADAIVMQFEAIVRT